MQSQPDFTNKQVKISLLSIMKAITFAKILIRKKTNLFNDEDLLEYLPKNQERKLQFTPRAGNLILNKYLHIGQMIYLAIYEKKLFEDEVICFLNGGVILEVSDNWHKIIRDNTFKNEETNFLKANKQIEKFATFLIKILNDCTPAQLIEISHLDPGWQMREQYIPRYLQKNKIDMLPFIESYKKIFQEDIEIFKEFDT